MAMALCFTRQYYKKTVPEGKKTHYTEVNSSAFTLPNLTMLTANDKQNTAPSILRAVYLTKYIYKRDKKIYSIKIIFHKKHYQLDY